MQSAQRTILPDGRRLHLHHGPIDLIMDATGPDRAAALEQAAARFETILSELVPELGVLRAQAGPTTRLKGQVAQRMHAAVAPFCDRFVTPMAAVAGAVADEICAAAGAGCRLQTLYVNNGGDVAFHVAPNASLTAAIAAGLEDRITITGQDAVRGIATSGWRGRSHSLGIADSVSVLATTAARADAAATLIANAVDLPGSPKVTRRPATDLAPDSDLGDRLVTVDVAELTQTETDTALQSGAVFAAQCLDRGLIQGALLTLAGQRRIVGAGQLLTQPTKDLHDA